MFKNRQYYMVLKSNFGAFFQDTLFSFLGIAYVPEMLSSNAHGKLRKADRGIQGHS